MSFYLIATRVVLISLSFRYKITLVDRHKIPRDKGCIMASNHTKLSDGFLILAGFRKTVQFMAKEELFENKFLGAILRGLRAFPVKRGAGDNSALNTAIDLLQNGGYLGIFPEGTRTKDGTVGRAKSGTVVIASRAKADILPIGIYYGNKRLFRRQVTVVYGDLIEYSQICQSEPPKKSELRSASALLMSRISDSIEIGRELESKTKYGNKGTEITKITPIKEKKVVKSSSNTETSNEKNGEVKE